jgi:hypothetical protein
VSATLLEASQGPGELSIYVCVLVLLWWFYPSRTAPACPFYSLKEVQGYKMLTCGVTLAEGA